MTTEESGRIAFQSSFTLPKEAVQEQPKTKFYENRTFMSYMPEGVNRIWSTLKAQADKIRGYRGLKREFRKRMHYELNIDTPRSYNEKIQWKKLYDRNPLLPVTADKYAVRDYLREVLGKKDAEEILIPLYHVTDKPGEIPFALLPDSFVVKPNHGSQMHMIVHDKSQVSEKEIIDECRKWLRVYYGFYTHEWAYRNIKRKIIIEKLIETDNGELPPDYKFYCFHGKCRMIRVTENRLGKGKHTGYFDSNWQLLNAGVPGYGYNHPFERPDSMDTMMQLAEKLSKPFDFVRVDLYDTGSKIFFGELTHYEASGLARLEPETFDFELGKYWNIKPKYWE